jgi:hypothetical protein
MEFQILVMPLPRGFYLYLHKRPLVQGPTPCVFDPELIQSNINL